MIRLATCVPCLRDVCVDRLSCLVYVGYIFHCLNVARFVLCETLSNVSSLLSEYVKSHVEQAG